MSLSKFVEDHNPFTNKTKEPEEGDSYYDILFGASLWVKDIIEDSNLIIVEYEDGQSRIFTFECWTWSIDSGRFKTGLHTTRNPWDNQKSTQ
jgi:hypothetical protein